MQQRIVLIGPKFFGYSSAIVKYLNDRDGIDAIFIDERRDNSFFIKSIYRVNVFKRLFKLIITKRRKEIYREIEAFNPTDIIFISPEYFDCADLEFVERMKCRSILYMWDSFANKPSARPYVDKFDRCISFDFEDAKEHSMEILNLFAEREFFTSANVDFNKKFDVCFVGTLHSNRIKYLLQLQQICEKMQIRTKVHAYYGNYFYFFKAKIAEFYFRCRIGTWDSLTKKETAQIFKASSIVLDITHPNQRGLTSRTFEALASGATVLTNNKYALQYLDEYSNRIRIFAEDSFEADLIETLENFEGPSTEDKSAYLSLNRFCKELLG